MKILGGVFTQLAKLFRGGEKWSIGKARLHLSASLLSPVSMVDVSLKDQNEEDLHCSNTITKNLEALQK